MISVYNIHHSPKVLRYLFYAIFFSCFPLLEPRVWLCKVWDRPEEFIPERFDLDGPVPNESNTDYRFIPFSGGPRKCVGDQFAMLQSVVALAIFLQNFNFELVPDQIIGMTTGATIHTTNVTFAIPLTK